MTDKELNRAILCELVKIADGVFEKTNIKAGTYTAAELVKQKDVNGKPVNSAISKELYNKSYEVCVEGFKCSFLACQVFTLVWRFEQLAGVKSNEKKRFVRISEAKKDVLCSFYVNIEKSHTSLCKLVAADELRPVMTQIFLDAKTGCLVASNGYVIKQVPIQVDSENEIPNGLNLYINPKQIENIMGKNRVDVYENGGFNATVITNIATGTQYRNNTAGRFPNYRAVYPMLRRDGYIQFSKKEIKPLIQFCKCASKEASNATMTIHLEKGCSNVLFSCVNTKDNSVKERRFCLDAIAEMTVRIGISGKHLSTMAKDWDGGMWIVDPSRAIILDYKNDATGLIMTKLVDDSLMPEKGECNINPLERNKTNEAAPVAESTPTAEAAPVAESTPTAEAAPVNESEPTAEEAPELDAAPTYDVCEKSPAKAAPVTESEPIAEAAPELDAAPTYEACEKSPVEAAPVTESEPIAETAPELDAAPTYEAWKKSPVEAMEWPWQIRILLAILHGFGLAKSPLRYVIREKLQECIEAILPAAVPTETLLQAIRPALSTQICGLYPTLSDFDGISTHLRSGQNLSKVCAYSTRIASSSAPIGGRGAVAKIGGRGGVAMAGSRGGVAMIGGRGGVAASMRRAAAAMSHAAGVSLPLPYALCDSSPITRPTGVSPPYAAPGTNRVQTGWVAKCRDAWLMRPYGQRQKSHKYVFDYISR